MSRGRSSGGLTEVLFVRVTPEMKELIEAHRQKLLEKEPWRLVSMADAVRDLIGTKTRKG